MSSDRLQAIIDGLREAAKNGMAAAQRRLEGINSETTGHATQKVAIAEGKRLTAERRLAAARAIDELSTEILACAKSGDSEAALDSLADLIPILMDVRPKH
ncbi:MAG: hypothetical protein JWN70_5133 [Planctomycetaceae bacterium]|nr:hypothetical protein [Planctomycetaceae bacterium]